MSARASAEGYAKPPFSVKSAADLPRAIALADAAGAIGQAHLLRALRNARVALFIPLPAPPIGASDTKFKTWAPATAGQPAIVLTGDDEGVHRGPADWPIAERAVAWARSIVVHSSRAEIDHYEAAIVAPQLAGRVVFVESSTATAPAWVHLVQAAAKHRPSVLLIRPPNGAVHPVPLDRSVFQ